MASSTEVNYVIVSDLLYKFVYIFINVLLDFL